MNMNEKPEKHGTLYVTRLDSTGTVLKPKRRRYVTVHRHSCVLSYYADSEWTELLGWIDLRRGVLDQSNESFILKDMAQEKVFQFTNETDRDDISSWCIFISQLMNSIPNPNEYGARPEDIKGAYGFHATVDGFRKDELALEAEYKISCHVVYVSKSKNKKTQTRWMSWKSNEAFKELDMKLRNSLGWQMDGIEFPRDRKRDALFSRKSVLTNRQQVLNDYLQHVFGIPNVTEFHKHHACSELKDFLRFDECFGEDAPRILVEVSEHEHKHHHKKRSKALSKKAIEVEDTVVNEVKAPVTVVKGPAELELVTGAEADELNKAIFQAVLTETRGKVERVDAFKAKSRDFNNGGIDAVSYYDFLKTEFGLEFAEWLVKDIVHIVPNDVQRKELFDLSRGISKPTGYHVEVEINPEKAKLRHQDILNTVSNLFNHDDEKTQDFQDQTKSFGKGEIGATEYVAYLQGAIGIDETESLVLSMAKLLGNVEKRKDLLNALLTAKQRYEKRKKKRSKQFSADTFVVPPSPIVVTTEEPVRIRKKREQSLSTTAIPSTRERSTVKTSRSAKNIAAPTAEMTDLSLEDADDEGVEASEDTDENPVLARLRKQGAVNYLGAMQLKTQNSDV